MATAACQAMAHLQNTTRGNTPAATVSIHTGIIRVIFTYASEVWHPPDKVQDNDSRYLARKRLEYQRLRRITEAYHSSNYATLVCIAVIESLERKLDVISVSWFARSVRNGDPNIGDFLLASSASDHHHWDDDKNLFS